MSAKLAKCSWCVSGVLGLMEGGRLAQLVSANTAPSNSQRVTNGILTLEFPVGIEQDFILWEGGNGGFPGLDGFIAFALFPEYLS